MRPSSNESLVPQYHRLVRILENGLERSVGFDCESNESSDSNVPAFVDALDHSVNLATAISDKEQLETQSALAENNRERDSRDNESSQVEDSIQVEDSSQPEVVPSTECSQFRSRSTVIQRNRRR